jgi:hypothetical protein
MFDLILFSQLEQCISGAVFSTTVLMSLAVQAKVTASAINNAFALIF